MGKNVFTFDNSLQSGWFLYDGITAGEKVRKKPSDRNDKSDY
jgi:hypothetical protein